ncbi:MAG: sugar ABC transporter permease [Spirochaetia bacterium]
MPLIAHKQGSRWAPFWMVAPAVAFLLLISIYPLITSLYYSFTDFSLTTNRPPRFVFLGNFRNLILDDRFWNSLKVTVIYTVGVVGVEMSIGLLLALSAMRNTRFRQVARSFLLVPMMLTPVVMGLMWKYMFNPENGIVNWVLGLLRIPGPVWLGDPGPALPAVMLIDVWQWTPFVFLILSSGIASLPQEVFEAARVDGCSQGQTLRHITLPLLTPFMLVALLIRFIDSFKVFDTVYVMTRGGPANVTESLSIYTFKVGLNFFNMGYAAALSYVILIIITIASQQFVKLERTA